MHVSIGNDKPILDAYFTTVSNYHVSVDGLTLIEAVHFWPYFNRGSPSRQSLGALGQISISSCKSLDGGGGGADADASDDEEQVV